MLVEPKPAATIMLAREHSGRMEILLLKRNKALKFAGGAWVFPGGKIEPEELEHSESEMAAAKLAAVRETKEESGLDIDPDQLIYYRHWTTPPPSPKRFATWFFFGQVQDNNQRVQIDDSEIKEHLWTQPQVALDKMLNGKLNLMPPTFISLQIIRNSNSIQEARKKLLQEKPIVVLPVARKQGSEFVLMYNGDAGYEAGDPKITGPRHRFIMDQSEGKIKFEHRDCADFPPVNGGDDFFGR